MHNEGRMARGAHAGVIWGHLIATIIAHKIDYNDIQTLQGQETKQKLWSYCTW